MVLTADVIRYGGHGHTHRGSQFCWEWGGVGDILLSRFLSSQREERAGGRFQQQVSASSHRSRWEGKDSGDAGGLLGEICGGRQAGTEFRGARGILPLT